MIVTALKSIMFRKYDKYRVYLHRRRPFSYFDGIFLLKYLTQAPKGK